MVIPFLVFWIVLYLARQELELKGVILAVTVWAALFAGFYLSGISPYYFVAAQSLLDIVLILIVFGGDITIR